jgi:exopolysaccharide production protein ExoZ
VTAADGRLAPLTWLQSGRGLAATMVVIQHASYVFSFPKYWATDAFLPLGVGERGVEFFFVLSGFIILHVHWHDLDCPRRLGPFLWKRFRRIYPTYWVVLAAVLPVYFLDPNAGEGFEREPGAILASILLVPLAGHDPILNVAWTLCREVMFYGLFALAIINRRAGLIAFAAWALLCLAMFNQEPAYPLDALASTRNLQFLMGMAAAGCARHGLIGNSPRAVLGAGVALLAACIAGEWFYDVLTFSEWTTAYGVAWTVLILGLVGIERQRGRTAPAPARRLGDASYSIYLVHVPVLSACAKTFAATGLIPVVPQIIAFALTVIIWVAAGLSLHKAVERPLLERLGGRDARHSGFAESA